jgi:hypothetical protein
MFDFLLEYLSQNPRLSRAVLGVALLILVTGAIGVATLYL